MIQTLYVRVLACDGCDKTYQASTFTTESPADIRGMAYGEGWRFPPALRRNDQPSTVLVHDTCPECAPTWTPKRIHARSPYRPKGSPR